MPSQKQKSVRSTAVWIFCLAFCVRIILLSRLWHSQYSPIDQSDMQFYHEWALRILAGQWTDHQAFIAMPGYAFMLAAVYAVAGVHPWLIVALNAISESCIAVTLFVLARMVFGGQTDRRGDWIGMAAATGWIFFTSAQAYSLVLMPTTYMILCFWIIVCWCLHARRMASGGNVVPFWQFLLAGAAAGVMATMVATILFVVPLVLAAAFFTSGKAGTARRRAVRCGAAIACAGRRSGRGHFALLDPQLFHR